MTLLSVLLVLVLVSSVIVEGFRLNNQKLWTNAFKPARMIPTSDFELRQSVDQLRQLAKDPIQGGIARTMISSTFNDFVFEGLLNEPSMSLMPPDAGSVERRAASIKSLFDILDNQPLSIPTLALIQATLKNFIHHNGHSTSGKENMHKLQDRLQEALTTVKSMIDRSETTTTSKLVAPKVYETQAENPPPFPSKFATYQDYLDNLRNTWHIRRHLEEVKQAEEIQKVLDKTKPLDLNDWYCMNPPGYY